MPCLYRRSRPRDLRNIITHDFARLLGSPTDAVLERCEYLEVIWPHSHIHGWEEVIGGAIHVRNLLDGIHNGYPLQSMR